MQGRKVAVTGASGGMGLETAKRLAQAGAELLLICRDETKGAAALAEVARIGSAAKPSLFIADLSSFRSIRAVATQIGGSFERVDVLVNNAGAVFSKRLLTVDGFEQTFAVNHLAPFLLTLLLLPLIRRSDAGRIVTVASRVHASALPFDNLQGERGYSTMKAYGQSKLENILFTYELARRLGTGGVTANCLAPGLVRSDFGRNAGGLIGLMPRLLALTPFSVSVAEGAKTAIYLASSPDVEGQTGGYYYKCAPARGKPISYDLEVARHLWELSVSLTGVDLN
jgi:NAD(P)-dependent dehydrogenase (short-subunit alcohol dehydrogenase family)